MMQTTFDFSPLYRSGIGFDRLFDMLDSVMRGEPDNYPPYNIERTGENAYRIAMAVAGFTSDDLSITTEPNLLVVTGQGPANDEAQYLHRGLALRPFERRFQLADYIKVSSAHFENGLLIIDLVREVPEELRPRRIEIMGGAAPKTIEHQPANGGQAETKKQAA